jgi:putative transposase
MPDHIHVLFTTNESIGAIAQLIKGGLSFAIRNEHKGDVWQDGYHEHRVRDAEDLRNQLLYIANNPSRRNQLEYAHVPTFFADRIDPTPMHLI